MSRNGLRSLLLVVLLLAPAGARASDREFKQIVRHLSQQYQKRPLWGMGFVGFLANCFAPSGVSGLRMAVFEELDVARRPVGAELDAFLQAALGPDYQPFVRVHSVRSGEEVRIFAREAGRNTELLILSLEPAEAVVIKVRVDAQALEKWMNEPTAMARQSSQGVNFR